MAEASNLASRLMQALRNKFRWAGGTLGQRAAKPASGAQPKEVSTAKVAAWRRAASSLIDVLAALFLGLRTLPSLKDLATCKEGWGTTVCRSVAVHAAPRMVAIAPASS